MSPLDAGGARMRQSDEFRDQARRLTPKAEQFVTDVKRHLTTSSVVVMVTETHDGEACDCIDKEMILEVGQEIELTHVCHDGRVDKVVAKVTAIRAAAGTGARPGGVQVSRFWSGGERVGKSPVCGPAPRVNGDRPTGVLRRCGRRPTISFARANGRPVDWGDDPRPWWRRIDWRLAAFIVGYVAAWTLAGYVAGGRG